MAGARQTAEMSQQPHTRSLVIDSHLSKLQTGAPFSPASTRSPATHASSSSRPRYPERAHISPSRDSFVSKPSLSEASPISITPSLASSSSDQQVPRLHSRHESSQRSSDGRKRGSGYHAGRHSQRNSRDVEKLAALSPRSLQSVHSGHSSRRTRGPVVFSDAHTTVTYNDGHDEEDELQVLENKVLGILIYLSGPAIVVSFIFLFWAIIATIIVAALQPLRLIKSRSSFGSELTSLLSPALRFQLRRIHSTSSSTSYRSGCLLATHLFSPFISFGVAFASWVAACFWFFSAVLGDPAGKDGYNDGKSTVLGVRAWWERWLCRALA